MPSEETVEQETDGTTVSPEKVGQETIAATADDVQLEDGEIVEQSDGTIIPFMFMIVRGEQQTPRTFRQALIQRLKR